MRIVQLPKMKLVGYRIVCEGDQYVKEIPEATIRLIEALDQIKHPVHELKLIGAYYAGDYTEEENGYWICIEVEQFAELPDGMVSVEIPAQQYAVIKHNGPNYDIHATYKKLHNWMSEQGLERKRRAWHLEIADPWSEDESENLTVDLYDTIGSDHKIE